MTENTLQVQDKDRHDRLISSRPPVPSCMEEEDVFNAWGKRKIKHESWCWFNKDRKQLNNQDKVYFEFTKVSITVVGAGFQVTNNVTGNSFPFATWKNAVDFRNGYNADITARHNQVVYS